MVEYHLYYHKKTKSRAKIKRFLQYPHIPKHVLQSKQSQFRKCLNPIRSNQNAEIYSKRARFFINLRNDRFYDDNSPKRSPPRRHSTDQIRSRIRRII